MRTPVPKPVKLLGIGLVLPLVLLALLIICTLLTLTVSSYVETATWRSGTSPLPRQVIEDLCEKLSLSPDDHLCSSDNILASDFYPLMRQNFRPDQVYYEDIQAILGEYQWEKDPLSPLGDGQRYFRVAYDLRGDRASAILFFFYENGLLFDIAEYYEGID